MKILNFKTVLLIWLTTGTSISAFSYYKLKNLEIETNYLEYVIMKQDAIFVLKRSIIWTLIGTVIIGSTGYTVSKWRRHESQDKHTGN